MASLGSDNKFCMNLNDFFSNQLVWLCQGGTVLNRKMSFDDLQKCYYTGSREHHAVFYSSNSPFCF